MHEAEDIVGNEIPQIDSPPGMRAYGEEDASYTVGR
jgi:hypothetical protein